MSLWWSRFRRWSLLLVVIGIVGWLGVRLPVSAQEPSPEPLSMEQTAQPVTVRGEVTKVVESGKEFFLDQLVPYQILEVQITSQAREGEVIQVRNAANLGGAVDLQYEEYQPGDKVKVSVSPGINGEEVYALAGRVKQDGLMQLIVLFIVVVLVVGRVWGALSLAGMVVSFAVIFQIIIPMIVNGQDPVVAAIVGSLVIIPTTFYISHGFNTKTHVGVIATIIALVITGLLAVYFVGATYLTGFASEEAGFLLVERQGAINIRGLLLAGIIISTLGVLDDVTVGQSSVVQQLKESNPEYDWRQLFTKGMKVGQDHISSMVNTLILVYSGSALPLLLLFYGNDRSFFDVIEFELIAEEIVRMLVGSIGLVMVAPVATLIAAAVFARWSPPKKRRAKRKTVHDHDLALTD